MAGSRSGWGKEGFTYSISTPVVPGSGASSPTHSRQLDENQLSPILSVRNCAFFSLQKRAASAELDASEHGDARGSRPAVIHDFSREWTDFSDTAAFIANLDLVISVDTAVAHLAGALAEAAGAPKPPPLIR